MNQDKSRKTEKPTPKRLRDARKKGQVARSKEVVSTALLIAAFVYFWLSSGWQLEQLKELILLPTSLYGMEFKDALKRLFDLVVFKAVYLLMLPLLGGLALVAIVANLAQFGVLFSAEPVKPTFDKINPINGFKRIFSAKQLLETLFGALKVAGIAAVLYEVIRASLGDLVHDVRACDVRCLTGVMGALLWRLIAYLLPLLLALAAIDYFFQRRHFLKEQRMSKDELRREFKDTEGDPFLKGQRRRQQRELAGADLKEKLKLARVLVIDVDATAVALRYEQGVTPLPLILAIARGVMAQQMIEVARDEHVPVVDDAGLVDLILKGGQVDQYIPSAAVESAARVIRQVATGVGR